MYTHRPTFAYIVPHVSTVTRITPGTYRPTFAYIVPHYRTFQVYVGKRGYVWVGVVQGHTVLYILAHLPTVPTVPTVPTSTHICLHLPIAPYL